MELGLLWGTLGLFFLGAVGILVSELCKSSDEYKVILLFLENSEEICEAVLRKICFRARYSKGGARVLVVDDHSLDDTAAIIQRMVRWFPELDLLERGGDREVDSAQMKVLLQNVFAVIDLRDFGPSDRISFA